MMQNRITIASAMLMDHNGNLLAVRKLGSSFYMLPGGKIRKNEQPIDALLRELAEELQMKFTGADFNFMGLHETHAVNEENTVVEGHIFRLKKTIAPITESFAEIVEIVWISPTSYQNYKLAHLLEEFVLPRWLSESGDSLG